MKSLLDFFFISKKVLFDTTVIKMIDYVELFGEKILSKEGLVPTSTLKGKIVGLYYS